MSNDFSDVLGKFGFTNILDSKMNFNYNYRYSPTDKYIYYQNAALSGDLNNIGNISIGYNNADSKSSSLTFDDRESINFKFQSVNFLNSNVEFSTSYDMLKDSHQTSTINYTYGDECFGMNVIYNKNFFNNTPDTLSIGMNFTFIGPVPQNIIDDLLLKPLDFDSAE